MKLINWIKSLFAPKQLPPIGHEWIDMVKKQKEIAKKPQAEQWRDNVRTAAANVVYAPPTPYHASVKSKLPPPTRPAPTMPEVKPAKDSSTESDWVTSAIVSGVISGLISSSDYSSSDSSSSSSDSFSGGGGGSFDGGGSSGDW